jgi:hypothetical protein
MYSTKIKVQKIRSREDLRFVHCLLFTVHRRDKVSGIRCQGNLVTQNFGFGIPFNQLTNHQGGLK